MDNTGQSQVAKSPDAELLYIDCNYTRPYLLQYDKIYFQLLLTWNNFKLRHYGEKFKYLSRNWVNIIKNITPNHFKEVGDE